MFKKIAIIYSIFVTAAIIGFFAGKVTTEQRLMEQHRLELNAAGERAAALSDTLNRAREEVGAIGESLSRQRTSVAELRELIGEVRTRYEKMEELLNSPWDNDCDVRSVSDCATDTDEGKISEK